MQKKSKLWPQVQNAHFFHLSCQPCARIIHATTIATCIYTQGLHICTFDRFTCHASQPQMQIVYLQCRFPVNAGCCNCDFPLHDPNRFWKVFVRDRSGENFIDTHTHNRAPLSLSVAICRTVMLRPDIWVWTYDLQPRFPGQTPLKASLKGWGNRLALFSKRVTESWKNSILTDRCQVLNAVHQRVQLTTLNSRLLDVALEINNNNKMHVLRMNSIIIRHVNECGKMPCRYKCESE